MTKGHAFSLDCIIEFGATMTLFNALGWIILFKCSLLASTSRADVDDSHFSLVFLYTRQIYCFATSFFNSISKTPVYSFVVAFLKSLWPLSIPQGCSFFFLSEESYRVPLHVTYPTHAILDCLLSVLSDLGWPTARTPWLVLFVQS